MNYTQLDKLAMGTGLPAPLAHHSLPRAYVSQPSRQVWRSLAVGALVSWGHRFPHHIALNAITPLFIRPSTGFPVVSPTISRELLSHEVDLPTELGIFGPTLQLPSRPSTVL